MANNLLDKASIILTPTAYDNGEALCVKPSDGSGDFDFSRNSAATRVNAQGLVENVQILSSNLVQNGDFSQQGAEQVSNGSFSQEGAEQISNGSFDTDTKWTTNTGWSISGGSANCDGTQGGNTTLVQQNGIKGAIIDFVVGKTYKVNFDVVVTSGVITQLEVASGYDGNDITTSGNHTTYITAVSTNDRFTITANPSFIGSIDNVSVREVGQDWSLVGDFEVNNQEASITNASQYSQLTNQIGTNYLLSGKAYKLTADIETLSISGALAYRYSGGAVQRIYTTDIIGGKFTAYFTMPQDGNFWFQTTANYTGLNATITNISVKEVGQNWTAKDGVIVSANSSGLVFDNSTGNASGGVFQNIGLSDANKYQMTATMQLLTGASNGTFTVFSSSANGTSQSQIYSGSTLIVGGNAVTETFEFSPATGDVSIQFTCDEANATYKVSNVTAVQVTSDTNLPRINYEGFSYQDALGSEEVVNGTFDSDTAWSKGAGWSIANGEATHTGGASYLSQSILNPNTQYKVKIKVSQASGSNFVQIYMGGSPASVLIQNVGEYEYIFTSQPSIGLGFALRGAGNVTIDNVSVKEYLGQEVVPNSGCGSWLFEPQSTNLITQSELFSDAYWTKSGSPIVTLNYGISPSGENNSVRIQGNNSTAIYHSGGFSATDGRSIYVKATSGSGNIQLLTHNGNTDNVFSIDENWQRVEINTSSSIPAIFYAVDMRGSSTNIYDIEIWGAQLEQQSYATSYIPTSGSTVTRNQDVCTNGGSLASINSTEGTLYGEFSSIASDNNSNWINISDGTAANWLFVGRDFNKVRIYLRANNAVVVSDTTTPLANNNKVALSYKSGDIRAYINGSEVVNLTSAFSFTSALNTLNFNAYNGGGTQTQIAWKAVAVWKEALTDSELTSLTTI